MAPSQKNSVATGRKKRAGQARLTKTSTRRPPVARAKKKTVALRQKRSPATSTRRPRAKPSLRGVNVLRRKRFVSLQKYEANPVIEPRNGNFWEMKATFNPAAVNVDGRVHLLYRAIGGDDMSTLGYAVSDDGVTIAERPDAFAFEHRSKTLNPLMAVPKISYLSGGGSTGGSEDPRLVLMDDNRIYLTYTAFDGWGSVRIALSSIAKDDFINRRWRWSSPVFLSPPGEVHKNWVLFPEKINGKFVVLHSISPEVLIDYVDDLSEFEDDEKNIKSHYSRFSNADGWDTWVRGAGPPPIRTRLGWLLLYHAMDARDPNRYKLGAMILDAGDPTKILYRSRVPVLAPEEWYENTGWKSGVIYSCGAVVKDGELYVYYGGADSVVCVAVANLDHFLDELVRHGAPRLTRKNRVKVKN